MVQSSDSHLTEGDLQKIKMLIDTRFDQFFKDMNEYIDIRFEAFYRKIEKMFDKKFNTHFEKNINPINKRLDYHASRLDLHEEKITEIKKRVYS